MHLEAVSLGDQSTLNGLIIRKWCFRSNHKKYIFTHLIRNLNSMTVTEIQNLIKFVAKSGVHEVELEMKDVKLLIKAKGSEEHRNGDTQVVMPQMPMAQMQASTLPAPVSADTQQPAISDASDSNLITIKSPMIGTFYRSSSPDKPLFVNVDDSIQVGKVVCIIEAMKLFNEIESEVSGKIVKVLVEDSTPVEYDQPLFIVEPA